MFIFVSFFRYVDDYRLCCSFADLGGFSIEESCETTEMTPPFNLCGRLLQNNALRVAVWVLAIGALIGNVLVVTWRLRQKGDAGGKKTLSFMVLNLALSDFLMGVYMMIIAAADLTYGEDYSKAAHEWRSSALCKFAGVVTVLSSEASVFL